MLKASQPLCPAYSFHDHLTHMAEGSMPQVMAHSYGPGKLRIKAKGPAYRAGNRGNMEDMLHSGTYMVIGGSEENLSLVLQPPEGR